MNNEEEFDYDDIGSGKKKGGGQTSSVQITLFAWIAILAACCVIAVITLQVIEILHYSAPPSVWPNSVEGGAMQAEPASPATPGADSLPADEEAPVSDEPPEAASDPGQETEPGQEPDTEPSDETAI